MNPIPNGTNYFSSDQSTKKALQLQFNDLIDQFSETLTKEQSQILVTKETKEALKKTLYLLGTQFSKYVFAERPITNPSFDQETLLSIRACIQNLGNDKNIFTKNMCQRFRAIIKRTISVVPGQLKNTLKELDDAFAGKEARLSSSPYIPSAPPLPSPSNTRSTANNTVPPPPPLPSSDTQNTAHEIPLLSSEAFKARLKSGAEQMKKKIKQKTSQQQVT